MRADFLDRFTPYPKFGKLTEKRIRLMTDMDEHELRLAIEQPAAQHGIVFEKGLVEEIIKDVQVKLLILIVLKIVNLLMKSILIMEKLSSYMTLISTQLLLMKYYIKTHPEEKELNKICRHTLSKSE